MESEQQVKTYRVKFNCPECEIELECLGPKEGWFKNSKNYRYKCDKCSAVYESSTKYPYTKYTPVKTGGYTTTSEYYGYYSNN